MSMPNVLVVEDDDDLREAVVETLTTNGYDCQTAANGIEALESLRQDTFQLVLSDVQMPKLDGMALLDKIHQETPELPVLLMTAYGSIDKAVQAIKEGAYDYLTKPFESSYLLEKMAALMSQSKDPFSNKAILSNKEGGAKRKRAKSKQLDIVLEDPLSKSMYGLAEKVAQSDSSVMITGPSGTGKEIISQYIHQKSARSEGPFVALNCAAIPENMLEAILFGYEKGAFTGAYQAAPGKFEQANGGTILLDEITEMPLVLQSKLLRVLQEREVERLGGKKVISVDVRVIATSNRDLALEVAERRFREDLFYRLNVFPLQMHALADRNQDVVPLAEFFLKRYALDSTQVSLTDASKTALICYQWPGNIRQLENVIQRALVLKPKGLIEPDDLLLEPVSLQEKSQENRVSLQAPLPGATAERESESSLGEDLKKREYHVILDALKHNHGSRKDTAKALGISSRTLRYKMAKMRDMGCDFSSFSFGELSGGAE